jgi:hypothetical protein
VSDWALIDRVLGGAVLVLVLIALIVLNWLLLEATE